MVSFFIHNILDAKKKMWILAFVILGLGAFIGYLGRECGLEGGDFLVIFFWFSFVFGHLAHDYERIWLVKHGFQFSDIVLGNSEELASARFLDRKTDQASPYHYVETP